MQERLIKEMRKCMRVLGLALIFLVAFSNTTARSEGNEYSIKSMFILNFIKYIEWPVEGSSNFFRIGVIGKSDMYDALTGMTENRNETKQIKIEEVTDESKEGFKIIVISKSENGRMEEILKKYKSKGVLLISDEFKGKNMPAINLINVNNKIRFEINITQAHEEGIKISSQLTELAVTIKP